MTDKISISSSTKRKAFLTETISIWGFNAALNYMFAVGSQRWNLVIMWGIFYVLSLVYIREKRKRDKARIRILCSYKFRRESKESIWKINGGNDMKTGKNNATNNMVIRFWSKHHYGADKNKFKTDYSGSITEVQSKQEIKFHSPAQLLSAIEILNKEAEKRRRILSNLKETMKLAE